MLQSLKKSMISATYDQLSKVIYNTQNCYHHHHYYHIDLIYRCSVKTKQNKRYKRRNRSRNRSSRDRKFLKTKYPSNCKNEVNSCSNSANNSVANAWYSANYNECCKVNLQLSSHIRNNLKYVWLNFQNCFNYLQLVLVLALLTSTAHSIDLQGKVQRQKLTTSPPLLATFNYSNTMAILSYNEPSLNVICHRLPNALQRASGGNANLKFQTHIRNRFRNGQRHLQWHISKILKNLNPYNKNSSKCLASNKRLKFKTHSDNEQNPINIHDQHADELHHYLDDSTTAIKKPKQSYKNKHVIEIKNKMTKEVEQHLRKIDKNSNNRNDRTKKYNNSHNNKSSSSYIQIENDMLTINTNKKSSNNINEHSDSALNDFDNNDRAKFTNFKQSFNLLPPAGTSSKDGTANQSLQFIHKQQQQQHIDHNKLMKLVMDGLGLKQVPNMEMVNISQEEYVSKYREYLQRVHLRKRRESRDIIGEYDATFLRPLEIFSIVSNSALISQHQGYHKSHNETVLRRQKRNALTLKNDEQHEENKGRKQRLEERVRNILFLKKKYQKPRSTKRERDERKTNIRLMFALKPEILNLSSSDIEEANIRLVLIHSPILAIRNSKNKKTKTKPKSNACGSNKSESQKNLHPVNVLNLKLYFISSAGKRVMLAGQKVDIHVDLTKPDETHTQWLQFDVSKAVKSSIDDKSLQHVVLELQCDNCKRVGARILNDAFNTAADAQADDPLAEGHQLMPVLNIIGHFDQSHSSVRPHKYVSDHHENKKESTTTRHYHHHQAYDSNKNRPNRRTNCYKANQRCCRHSMEVTFKEIKGFEFIIQPKVFDAGYCHGRCPPRYNPAHHHALLQSLIWKQNHDEAPRPCCAPSKLVELEVLHVDEKDSEKLKISTWSDMKVVECACS